MSTIANISWISVAISQEVQQKPALPMLLQISRVLLLLVQSNYRDESWLLRISEGLEELAAVATQQQDELLELMVEAKCMVSFSS